ncbi:AAA family ATPase [Prevotella sp. P5-92]|uniref:ATP-binding protein n=1 Tax=Prevotella sp. P5-92 TaxID=2024222 RepID=UPI000B970974|nr:ATP-binding protein [Prevotella sp. P5-92]OYP58515.1 AAA family ATPase [Prevotella sp. P5-92]
MNNRKEAALDALHRSIQPVPQELNEIDWKGGLSSKTDRLAQHICAFANLSGGGFLVFGISDDAEFEELDKATIEETTKKLGNIAKNNLAWSIQLEHAVLEYEGHALLFIRIPEQQNKPVYLRGRDIYEAYIRSAGHTVKMSREQVHEMLALSHGLTFEKRVARSAVMDETVLELLDYEKLYELIDKRIPQNKSRIMDQMCEFGMIERKDDRYDILNLGAILFARKLKDFGLENKEVIVRKYSGTNNLVMELEYKMSVGYAVGFEDIVDTVMRFTSKEKIEVRREAVPTYPRVAVREFAANLMVHQDFGITGMPITIEIFANRLVITNPGYSLNDVNRLIDLPPHSRNEQMAQLMLQLGLCERRGSGVDRAVEAMEKMLLPAYKAENGSDFTRVTLYPKKSVSDLTKEERIEACYQHCCLAYADNETMNNQSVRERFGLNKNQGTIASHIIADTVAKGLIKSSNPDSDSRKFVSYVPFYA